jgi:hypothetical protein
VKQYWGGNFLLIARNAAEPADLTRLFPSVVAERFGAHGGVTEWDELLRQATWIPEHTTVIRPDDSRPVLTDDHCPLERMTDSFVEEQETEILGR